MTDTQAEAKTNHRADDERKYRALLAWTAVVMIGIGVYRFTAGTSAVDGDSDQLFGILLMGGGALIGLGLLITVAVAAGIRSAMDSRS